MISPTLPGARLRLIARLAGAAGGAALAGFWSGRWEIVLSTFLVLWVISGLFELMARPVPAEKGPACPDEQRPADGRVDVVALAGVAAEPNPVDPRFGRFRAIAAPQSVLAPPPSRPRLRGRIVFVSLFVGRDGTSWSDQETARTCRALERAAGWIEREAARWHAPVNVDLAGTYFLADDPVPEEVLIEHALEEHADGLFEQDAEVKAISSASRAAAALGFRDVADLIGQISTRLPAAQPVWLLHPRRAGRSIAVVPTGPRCRASAWPYAMRRRRISPNPSRAAYRSPIRLGSRMRSCIYSGPATSTVVRWESTRADWSPNAM